MSPIFFQTVRRPHFAGASLIWIKEDSDPTTLLAGDISGLSRAKTGLPTRLREVRFTQLSCKAGAVPIVGLGYSLGCPQLQAPAA